jgi:hypothetical protein
MRNAQRLWQRMSTSQWFNAMALLQQFLKNIQTPTMVILAKDHDYHN